MKTSIVRDRTRYELEAKDFDYLEEFTAVDGSLGIDLTSKSNPLLSIHIGRYGVKYDNDVSARGNFIAVERVDVYDLRLLDSLGNEPHDYKSYIPTTTESLYELIQEFKFIGLGNTKAEDIKRFLTIP